ncbi:DNA-3-methyladenine glycosylase family protein [Pedobacter rhodius]|uniref:DNA-3-methyladenine glycosylase II n=1 Tax=Pedobacter rhodius TaxID=3004098 RepID=A0ABT4KUC9_9SPHI|nr:DNA-3-methyladenine glycosylase 2 family protein [Pedobacter sp. SJ11]MCZ4222370.1 DNA-3-methyladenine glycosylase 2 family protein [Pedobacter sp. SJ11]
MFEVFSKENFHQICDRLAEKDEALKHVINLFGYPPFWSRPNTFESLVHIILEQQVSLASALAALNKLRAKIVDITPENFLLLTDEELRACYFSRQKTIYVRHLAKSMVAGEIVLESLVSKDDAEIRTSLTKIKGIGNWTVDIYLIFILHHCDVFPLGDLAAVNALKKIKRLDIRTAPEIMLETISHWKPYRTIGTMLLWHYYLEERKPSAKLKGIF